MDELLALANRAFRIFDSDLSWEAKYDLIFSDDISKKIFRLVSLDGYYDPDTSYEEDVRAFIGALRSTLGIEG